MCKKNDIPIAGLVKYEQILPLSAAFALPVMVIIMTEKLKLL